MLHRPLLDFFDTAVVMTGVDHGLLFGHLGFVLLLGHADGPMRRPLRNCRTTGSSLVSTSRGPNITRCLRNSMPMLSGTVRAMLMCA